jgi:hypothetical protein
VSLACLALLAVAGPAFAGTNQKAALSEISDVVVVVAGEPYLGGLILPPTEAEFRFRWADTGDILTFRWSTLEEFERKRIQTLYGIEVAEDGTRLVWGEQVKCLRLRLATTRKSLEGMELPERALPGHRCLKTATQVVQIPIGEIEAEDRIEKRESEVYSPEEGYDRLVARTPPAAASVWAR